MPLSGRPYTPRQVRTDRAFLAVAAVCFLLTLLVVALLGALLMAERGIDPQGDVPRIEWRNTVSPFSRTSIVTPA